MSMRQDAINPVARGQEHAALLAHDAGFVPGASNRFGEPRLRFGATGTRVRCGSRADAIAEIHCAVTEK